MTRSPTRSKLLAGAATALALSLPPSSSPVLGALALPRAAAAADQPRDWGGADAPYLQELHARVHPRWAAFLTELGRLDRRYQDPGLRSELLLVIDSTGALTRTEYLTHAALKGFDDAPGDLLKELGSLPAPPAAVTSDDGSVYVRWRFSRRQPGCEELQIVERRLLPAEAVPRLVMAGRAAEAAERIRKDAQEAERPGLLRVYVENLARWAALSKDAALRELAAVLFAHLPEGQADLMVLLEDPAPGVRLRALEALSGQSLGSAVAPALRKALEGEDRALAALLLARLKDQAAVPVLRQALEEGKWPAETAASLRSLGDAAEAGRIVGRLLSQPDRAHIGALAARALGDPAHGELLVKAYSHGSEAVRLSVLDSFGSMGPKTPAEARATVLRAMRDLSPKVRAHAMRACSGFGDRTIRIRYRLIDALADPDALVRAAAAGALVEVGGEEAKDEILRVLKDPHVGVRAAALIAALSHPYPSANTLISRLRKDPAVEEAASRTKPVEDRQFPFPDLSTPAPEEAGTESTQRPLLIASRVVPVKSAAGEEQRLTELLLSATTAEERLRAAIGWLTLERPPASP